jgi:hypothetical protein
MFKDFGNYNYLQQPQQQAPSTGNMHSHHNSNQGSISLTNNNNGGGNSSNNNNNSSLIGNINIEKNNINSFQSQYQLQK